MTHLSVTDEAEWDTKVYCFYTSSNFLWNKLLLAPPWNSLHFFFTYKGSKSSLKTALAQLFYHTVSQSFLHTPGCLVSVLKHQFFPAWDVLFSSFSKDPSQPSLVLWNFFPSPPPKAGSHALFSAKSLQCTCLPFPPHDAGYHGCSDVSLNFSLTQWHLKLMNSIRTHSMRHFTASAHIQQTHFTVLTCSCVFLASKHANTNSFKSLSMYYMPGNDLSTSHMQFV